MKLLLNLKYCALQILIGFAVIASLPINSSVLTVSAQTTQNQREQSFCCDYWAPNWLQTGPWKNQRESKAMRSRMQRHWIYLHGGIPEIYRGAQSNLDPTKEEVKEGGKLYSQFCASCHGIKGLGDGETGKSLSPSPALLAFLIQNPTSVDEYLLWTISDGGELTGSDMPAFNGKLSRNQIWKIIAYMRSGFKD